MIPLHSFFTKRDIMRKNTNVLGKKFNMLTALSFDNDKKKRNLLCRCDCGKLYYTDTWSLTSNHIKSCGCQRYTHARITGKQRHNWQGYESISKSFICNCIYSAKTKKLPFNLTIKYIWDLYIKQNMLCAITKLPIQFCGEKIESYKPKFCSVSIDRIDNNKGYIEGNIRLVHKIVNIMKNEIPDDIFIYMCHMVTEHNKLTNPTINNFIFHKRSLVKKRNKERVGV